jgi:hypothetical protein
MSVWIAGPSGGDSDPGAHRVDEGVGRRGPATVMGDLQEVEPRQSPGQQAWIDVLLDVAGQQEAALTDRPQKHDRHVVDARPGVGRLGRDLAADRPEDTQTDLVDRQPVAGRDREMGWRADLAETIEPCGVARPRAAHTRFEHPPDAVAREQQREPSNVVLVGMGQDDHVDPAIPRRDAPVELDEQPIRVRSAVDQQSTAARALDEDRIALADVEDRDPGDAGRPRDRDRPGHGDRDDQPERGHAECSRGWFQIRRARLHDRGNVAAGS